MNTALLDVNATTITEDGTTKTTNMANITRHTTAKITDNGDVEHEMNTALLDINATILTEDGTTKTTTYPTYNIASSTLLNVDVGTLDEDGTTKTSDFANITRHATAKITDNGDVEHEMNTALLDINATTLDEDGTTKTSDFANITRHATAKITDNGDVEHEMNTALLDINATTLDEDGTTKTSDFTNITRHATAKITDNGDVEHEMNTALLDINATTLTEDGTTKTSTYPTHNIVSTTLLNVDATILDEDGTTKTSNFANITSVATGKNQIDGNTEIEINTATLDINATNTFIDGANKTENYSADHTINSRNFFVNQTEQVSLQSTHATLGINIGNVNDIPITIGKNAGTKAIELEQDVNAHQDVVITGDLTVNGTTTTSNSNNLDIADVIIKLADGNLGSKDIGWLGDTGTTPSRIGVIYDNSDDKMVVIKTNDDADVSGNVSITSYADFKCGALNATGSINSDVNLGAINVFVNGCFTQNVAPKSGENFINFTATDNNYSGTINVDTINEDTLNNGVSVEGVLLKDGNITGTLLSASSNLNVDTITEYTLNNGVDIETINLKDGNLTLTGTKKITCDIFDASVECSFSKDIAITTGKLLKTDTINEQTLNAGTTIEGSLLKDNGITNTGNVSCLNTVSNGVFTNQIDEHTGGHINFVATSHKFTTNIECNTINEYGLNLGVTIEGIKLRDNYILFPATTSSVERTLYYKADDKLYTYVGGAEHLVAPQPSGTGTGDYDTIQRFSAPASAGTDIEFCNIGVLKKHSSVAYTNLTVEPTTIMESGVKFGTEATTTYWDVNETANVIRGVVSSVIKNEWNLSTGILTVEKGIIVTSGPHDSYIQVSEIHRNGSQAYIYMNDNVVISGLCQATQFYSTATTLNINAGGSGNADKVQITDGGDVYPDGIINTPNTPAGPKEIIGGIIGSFTMDSTQEGTWAAGAGATKAHLWFNSTSGKLRLRKPDGSLHDIK
jgi:hypothetical protein